MEIGKYTGIQEGEERTPAAVVRNENDILELIKQENSWEQILYDVVAIEDLDPWNLDISVLSRGFTQYIADIKELDFRIPAKWVIIASMLLRMKSDCIKILKTDDEPNGDALVDIDGFDEIAEPVEGNGHKLDMDPLEAVPRRKPVRRITITELVSSLRNVFAAQTRREDRLEERRGRINISSEDITKRIENLYKRITGIMSRVKGDEIKFSQLVETWERNQVVDTFLPLVHLDQERMVSCRQEKIFDEIFISKRARAA
jgi:segregation and condensation protein A